VQEWHDAIDEYFAIQQNSASPEDRPDPEEMLGAGLNKHDGPRCRRS
jgi:hypothetical protein